MKDPLAGLWPPLAVADEEADPWAVCSVPDCPWGAPPGGKCHFHAIGIPPREFRAYQHATWPVGPLATQRLYPCAACTMGTPHPIFPSLPLREGLVFDAGRLVQDLGPDWREA